MEAAGAGRPQSVLRAILLLFLLYIYPIELGGLAGAQIRQCESKGRINAEASRAGLQRADSSSATSQIASVRSFEGVSFVKMQGPGCRAQSVPQNSGKNRQ